MVSYCCDLHMKKTELTCLGEHRGSSMVKSSSPENGKEVLSSDGIFFNWVPIWICLVIPNHLWLSEAMDRCASVVGKPISVDLATAERLGSQFAKICVEVSTKDGFPDQVPAQSDLEGDSAQEWVTVAYEWKLPVCTSCCSFGHVMEVCPLSPPSNFTSGSQPVCENAAEAVKATDMHQLPIEMPVSCEQVGGDRVEQPIVSVKEEMESDVSHTTVNTIPRSDLGAVVTELRVLDAAT